MKKTLADLQKIRESTKGSVDQRMERDGTRIVVGMATCGIAAGARPVLLKLVEECSTRGLSDVTVSQTGCIGMCRLEPMVEVYKPGEEKVTYVNVTPEMVPSIINNHIVNDNPVMEYTIGAAK